MSDDLTQKLPGEKEPTALQDDDRISLLIVAVESLSTAVESLSTRVESLSTSVDSLRSRVESLSTSVESLRIAVEDVKARVEVLENSAAEGSLETKPIWERALAEIAATRAELAETRSELRAEMRDGFLKLGLKIELLNEDSLTLRADQRQLERRVETLESKTP